MIKTQIDYLERSCEHILSPTEVFKVYSSCQLSWHGLKAVPDGKVELPSQENQVEQTLWPVEVNQADYQDPDGLVGMPGHVATHRDGASLHPLPHGLLAQVWGHSFVVLLQEYPYGGIDGCLTNMGDNCQYEAEVNWVLRQKQFHLHPIMVVLYHWQHYTLD